MQPRTRAIISFAILIIVLFGLYFFADWFSKATGYALGEDEKIKLAQCLSNKETVLYTSTTCPNCDMQLKLFGEEASEYLNIFECHDLETGDCTSLQGVPSWKINDKFYLGFKNFKELIEISSCDVK